MNTLFHYEARGPSGRTERGAVAASSQQEAVNRLRRRNLTPLTLRAHVGVGARQLDHVSAREFCRTLAQLLDAGLPFSRALSFASEELPPLGAALAAHLMEAAERGESLSGAFDELTGTEARLLGGVFKAGETSGRLAEALAIAARSFARSAALKNRIGAALIYPSFVILATLATLACFMLMVVPAMAQAFSGAAAQLPPSTRALLELSAWLQRNGLILLLALSAGAALFAVSPGARKQTRLYVARALASPLGLGIAPRLDFASFAGLSALSLEAGVPAAAAFSSAASAIGNSDLQQALHRAIGDIRSGARPSEAFALRCSPPRSFSHLTYVGEESGRLAQSLAQADALLTSEAEQRLERLGALAGPLVTLLLGSLVAAVVMSLFLGLLSLSELATL